MKGIRAFWRWLCYGSEDQSDDSDTDKVDGATPDAEPEPEAEIKVETMTITVSKEDNG